MQTESVIITNKGAEVAVCCMCLSCYCILLDKRESGSTAGLAALWKFKLAALPVCSANSSPARPLLPLLHGSCHRHRRWQSRDSEAEGCQITPVSATRGDVKCPVGLSVSCRLVCRKRPWVIGDCFMHSFLWGWTQIATPYLFKKHLR